MIIQKKKKREEVVQGKEENSTSLEARTEKAVGFVKQR